MSHTKEEIALAVLISVVAVTGYMFVVSGQLAGFSDDSATYLIMADVLSPFADIPESFLSSFEYFYLPPGFAFVLAALGGGIRTGHLLVLMELLLALYVLYRYFSRITDPGTALLTLAIFISLPGLWIEMLKIMPENQYILLSAVILLLFSHTRQDAYCHKQLSLIFLMMATLIMTRTIGITLLPALILWYLVKNRSALIRIDFYVASLWLVIPLAGWYLFKPEIQHSYFSDLIRTQNDSSLFLYFVERISNNCVAIYKAWLQNIILFSENQNIERILICIIFGISFFIGWYKNKYEIHNLYLMFYLFLLLIWPYPNEMERFLYPAMPFMIINFLSGIKEIGYNDKLKIKISSVASAIFILVLTLPALIHIYNRNQLGLYQYGQNITNVVELYTIPSLNEAIATALIWNKIQAEMRDMQRDFDEDARFISAKPQFFTYLSGYYAEFMPDTENVNINELLNYIEDLKVTHIIILPFIHEYESLIDRLTSYIANKIVVKYSAGAKTQNIITIFIMQ